MITVGKREIGCPAAVRSRPGQAGWIGLADRSGGGGYGHPCVGGGSATMASMLRLRGGWRAAVCRAAAARAAMPPGVPQRWWVGWGGGRTIDDIGHVPRCPDAAGQGATAGRATKGEHHEAAQACTCVDLFGGALRRGRAASQRMHDAVDRAGPVTCGVPFSGLGARCGKPVVRAPVAHASACSRVQKQVRNDSGCPGRGLGAFGEWGAALIEQRVPIGLELIDDPAEQRAGLVGSALSLEHVGLPVD